jgi:hypothetical protein
MDVLDKMAGIIGYAVVNSEDGTVEEVKGSSTTPLGDLSAFFSSAGDVIKNTLSLGNIYYISLCYGAHRLVIFQQDAKYIGIEIEREQEPANFIDRVKSTVAQAPATVKEAPAEVKEELIIEEKIKEEGEPVREEKAVEQVVEKVEEKAPAKAAIELPRSISSKLQQINLLVDEFSAEKGKAHWLDILNQGLGILGGDILLFMGLIGEHLEFKEQPPADKEDDFVQCLRTIIDFLVKKAVEEMGSSQARVKVQVVIEKMKQG